jgi:hypothetical protein
MSLVQRLAVQLSRIRVRELFLWCSFASILHGQVNRTDLEKRYGTSVGEAIAEVKAGRFVGLHLSLLDESGAVEAIPDLEKLYSQTQDVDDKAKIAQVLVKLGDKDNTYWNFLVQQAMPAVNSDAPSPIVFDPQGKFVKGQPSPEFIAWSKANKRDPSAAAIDAVYTLPGNVMMLGATDDPRAIPILRQALRSPNPIIQAVAARGLADIKDKDSIPLIVDACSKRPTDAAAMIAESLVYFDDTQAQDAVDKYVPKDSAKVLRDARAHGRTPFR